MRRFPRWALAAGVAALLAVLSVPRAHAQVAVATGAGLTGPVYVFPYPFFYPYPYVGWGYPLGYPYGTPPPGWDPGHWEMRENRWGRRVEVWVPPHLQ